jgi:hypothetical protein
MVRLMDNGEAPDTGAEAPLSDLPQRPTRMLLKHPVSARVRRPPLRGDEAVAPTGQAVACAGNEIENLKTASGGRPESP